MRMPRPLRFLLRPVGPLFYPILCAAAFFWVLFFIGDYDHTWAHPEMAWYQIPTVMRNGPAFSPSDLLRVFQVTGFDSSGRSRFFAYLLQVLNLKFTIWLYRFIPPHPSFSLAWPVNLILLPLLFFHLVRLIGRSRPAAWIATALLLLSSGYLSGLAMLFHLAKPAALFLAVAAFYLAARAVAEIERRERLGARIARDSACLAAAAGSSPLPAGPGRFGALRARLAAYSPVRERGEEIRRVDGRITALSAWLLLAVFLAYFTDETAWFIPLALPLLFPRLFGPRPGRGWFLLGYVAGAAAFLAFVTWAAPRLVADLAGERGYSFWGLALGEGESALWRRFQWKNILANARYLTGSQFALWRPGPLFLAGANGRWLTVVLAYLGLAFFSLPRPRRSAAARVLAATALFILFQTLVLSRHIKVVGAIYYYANLFSLFLSLLAGLLLSGEKQPFATLNRVLVAALLILEARNFCLINRNIMELHERERYGFAGFFPREIAGMQGRHLTYGAVRRLWEKRLEFAAVASLAEQLPPRALVIVKEIALIGAPAPVPSSPPADPLAELEGRTNLLSEPETLLSASSFTAPEWRDCIHDGDPATIWHVAMDKLGEEAWIMADFRGEPRTVRTLAVLPRQDVSLQLFRRADLQARDSAEEEWETISPIDRESVPSPGEWCVWTFPNDRAYRYYRLVIREGMVNSYYSLAEMGMYE